MLYIHTAVPTAQGVCLWIFEHNINEHEFHFFKHMINFFSNSFQYICCRILRYVCLSVNSQMKLSTRSFFPLPLPWSPLPYSACPPGPALPSCQPTIPDRHTTHAAHQVPLQHPLPQYNMVFYLDHISCWDYGEDSARTGRHVLTDDVLLRSKPETPESNYIVFSTV